MVAECGAGIAEFVLQCRVLAHRGRCPGDRGGRFGDAAHGVQAAHVLHQQRGLRGGKREALFGRVQGAAGMAEIERQDAGGEPAGA